MKTFSFLVTLLILVSQVDARENPFVPTKMFQDEMQRMIEIDPEQEFMEKNDSQYEYSSQKQKNKRPKAKTAAQIKAQMQAKEAKKEKALALKMQALQKEKEEIKNNPLIYVKLRDDVIIDKKINVLPFIDIEYTNSELKIHSKYKVFKKFYLEKGNKLILDFRADTSFYTKHYDLESNAFRKFSVGNHKEDRFFRVVILLNENNDKYNVTYDENMVLVTFDKEMVQ